MKLKHAMHSNWRSPLSSWGLLFPLYHALYIVWAPLQHSTKNNDIIPINSKTNFCMFVIMLDLYHPFCYPNPISRSLRFMHCGFRAHTIFQGHNNDKWWGFSVASYPSTNILIFLTIYSYWSQRGCQLKSTALLEWMACEMLLSGWEGGLGSIYLAIQGPTSSWYLHFYLQQ